MLEADTPPAACASWHRYCVTPLAMAAHGSPVSARDNSWVALLASTVGLKDFQRARVRVFGPAGLGSEVRVVVQVFGDDARPVGATERVVSAGILATGLDLAVVYEGGHEELTAVAWVEPNSGELEFGALTATPAKALAQGAARLRRDLTLVELGTRVGAAAA